MPAAVADRPGTVEFGDDEVVISALVTDKFVLSFELSSSSSSSSPLDQSDSSSLSA